MGFRFRKSIRVGKILRINLSKSGIGASVGVPGYRVGIGPRGKRTTVSLPGTGLSYTTQAGTTQESKKTNQLQPAQFAASPTRNPANKKTCGIVALIGIAFTALTVMISLIFGFVSSISNWIKPEPTAMGIDQAVNQLYATMTMEAAINKRIIELTDLAPTATQLPTETQIPTETQVPTETPQPSPTFTHTPTNTIAPIVAPVQPQPVIQPTTSHPANATALCKDGTYSYSQTRSGTCSGHGGVSVWLK
jgi:hypothetical protein